MRRQLNLFLFLVLFASIFLVSCSDANKSYEQGKYSDAIKILDKKSNLNSSEYLLKAKCYLALGKENAALKNITLLLLLSSNNDESRAEAVDYFIQLNTFNSLTILALNSDDGLEAQIALFKAYANEYSEYGLNKDEALSMIEKIEEQVSSITLLNLLVNYGDSLEYTSEAFTFCLEDLSDENKEEYIELLCQYSQSSGMGEAQAHSCLSITDKLMSDSFFNSNNIMLSKLLKTKGNILDKLYDRVNARVYWNQAYRLNPNDTTLKDKLQ